MAESPQDDSKRADRVNDVESEPIATRDETEDEHEEDEGLETQKLSDSDTDSDVDESSSGVGEDTELSDALQAEETETDVERGHEDTEDELKRGELSRDEVDGKSAQGEVKRDGGSAEPAAKDAKLKEGNESEVEKNKLSKRVERRIPRQKSFRTRTKEYAQGKKERAKLRLRKSRAIRRKKIPSILHLYGAPKTVFSPYDTYFSEQVEPGNTHIPYFITKGLLDRVKYLLEVEKIDTNDSTLDPWRLEQTPLHWAAKGGCVEVAKLLVAHGADLHSIDSNGNFPIHVACWYGHSRLALFLAQSGDLSDLFEKDYDSGLNCFEWAALKGHSQVLQVLNKHVDSIWFPTFVDQLVSDIIDGRYHSTDMILQKEKERKEKIKEQKRKQMEKEREEKLLKKLEEEELKKREEAEKLAEERKAGGSSSSSSSGNDSGTEEGTKKKDEAKKKGKEED